ncbi:hypothetical protein LINPERPRIM_LOCUS16840 [Linum perenne]
MAGQPRRNGRGVTLGQRGMQCISGTVLVKDIIHGAVRLVAPAAAESMANEEVAEVRNEEVNEAEMADDEQEEQPPRNDRQNLRNEVGPMMQHLQAEINLTPVPGTQHGNTQE